MLKQYLVLTLATMFILIPSLLFAHVNPLASHQPSPDTLAPSRLAQEPRRGGVVTSFIAQIPTQLDPHQIVMPDEMQAVMGLYSQLLQVDPEHPTELIPDLAEQWTVDSKGLTYDFALRHGVQWHDGAPFTSADVVVTFARLLTHEFRYSRCGAPLRSLVQSIKALDTHRVRFQLARPYTAFLSLVASPWCAIVAQHILARDNDLSQLDSQLGTGPFRLKEIVPGQYIDWERNPNYYDPRYPYVDGVKQVVVADPIRRLLAVRRGDVLMWHTNPSMLPSQVRSLEKARREATHIFRQSLGAVWALHLNPHKPPFDLRDMRRAVHLVLDRQALLQTAFKGAGVPCAILDPSIFGGWALPIEEIRATPGCRQPKAADIAAAKHLVASHYPNGVTVDFVVLATGDYLERSEQVVAQLRQIGIRGQIKAYRSAAAWRRFRKRRYTIIAAYDSAVDILDPSALFTRLFTERAQHNWVRWRDATVESLVDQGQVEQEMSKRQQIYHRLQRYLLSGDLPSIIIGWRGGWFFHDQRLQNYQLLAPGLTHSFQKVWLLPQRAIRESVPGAGDMREIDSMEDLY